MEDLLKGRSVLVINEDNPEKGDDLENLRMQTVAMSVFQPIAESVFNADYRKITKKSLANLQKSFEVVKLSTLQQVSNFDYSKYEIIVGSGIGVYQFLTGGKSKKKIRDILYRRNKITVNGHKAHYWGILSAWKLVQLIQFAEDPNNVAERINLFRAMRGVHDFITGNLPVSTMTKVKTCTTLEDVDNLVAYCAYNRMAVFDFETRPKQKGLTVKDDIKTHSVNFHLSEPTVLSVSFQPGGAWVVPMFHHESPFDVGKDDQLDYKELYSFEVQKSGKGYTTTYPNNREPERWLFKNNQPVTRYNGTPVIYTEENKHYLDALFENWEYCKREEVTNLLKEKVFPVLSELFTNPDIRNVAHNYKFDRKVVRYWFGIRHMEGRQDDSMMMVHANQEDIEKGLKVVGPKYWPEFYGYGEDVDYANEDLSSLSHYAGVDTDITGRVRIVEEFKLLRDPLSYRVYRSLDMPKLRVLSDLEYTGMPIDTEYNEFAINEVDQMLEEVKAELLTKPTVKRYIHTARKLKKEEQLESLQSRLDKFTEKKLKDLDRQLEAWKAKDQTPAVKRKVQTIIANRHKVKGKKYYMESYPYKNPKEWFVQWQDLNTGQTVLDYELNFSSPKQMGELIYTSPVGYGQKMPIIARKIINPETRRKETIVEAYPTTNKDELGQLEDKEGFITKLLVHRLLTLIRKTYLQGIKDRLDPEYKVHCRYGTVRSQRLSSYDPNLQNIPSRTNLEEVKEMVQHVKRMFVPEYPETQDFFQVDLSQAELRWAAYLWNVPSLIKAYREGKDVHILAACMSKGKPYEWFAEYKEKDSDGAKYLRFQAKAYNFGLIYGMSAESFMEYCKIQYGVDMTLEEATNIRNMFLTQLHSAIPAAHEHWKNIGRKQGFVRTAYGSKRHVPYINSTNGENRSHDERVCLNSPVQGSSGQGLVFSMVSFSDWMSVTDLRGTVINTVHDSINGYADKGDRDVYLSWMLRACNKPAKKEYFGFNLNDKVLMESDAEAGHNWKDVKKLQIKAA